MIDAGFINAFSRGVSGIGCDEMGVVGVDLSVFALSTQLCPIRVRLGI